MFFRKSSFALKTLSLALLAGLPTGAVSQATNAWVTQCTSSSLASPYECVAQHQVRTEGNQVVFQISIVTREGRGGARLELIGPLGFYIPGGVQLSNDDAVLFDLPVLRCASNGCYLEAEIDTDDMEALVLSSELTLDFLTNPENAASVSVPVAGLADSLSLIAE